MSSNRCQKNVREFDKDFVDCERYLNKVLKRKIDKSRNPSGSKNKQNENKDRTVKPFLTGPPSRPHSSSAGLRVGSPLLSRKISTEKIVHKEVIGNGKAAVEITVKSKQKDTNNVRKRSRSTGSAFPLRADVFKSEKPPDFFKQNKVLDPFTKCKLSSQVFQRKTGGKSLNPQNIPWSEILKENRSAKPKDTVVMGNPVLGTNCPVKGKCHNSYDVALNTKTHLGIKDLPAAKPVIHSRACSQEQQQRKTFDIPESKHVNSKATTISGESSGFSSSIDEADCAHKSVQCWLPPSSAVHGDSTSTVSSTKIVEEHNRKTSDSAVGPPSTIVDTFSMFNPIRTLHFLIKELHGLVKKTKDKNLRRIIGDMEKALLRISPDMHSGDTVNIGTYTTSDPETLRMPEPVVRTRKHAIPITAETVARTLASVPALALRVDSSLFSTMDNTSGKTSLSLGAGGNSEASAVLFQKQLEESCMRLETMCQEMEANNTELRTQRDKLEEEVKLKNQELDNWASKERDYLQTISTLRSNLENSGVMLTELTTLTGQLREENKSLLGMREKNYKLIQQVQDSQRTNEQLQKDLKLLRLEKEKLVVINQGKDNELERFKKELVDIKSLVLDQMNTLKNSIHERETRSTFSSLSDILSLPSDLDSNSDTTPYITPRRPICSSPSSSRGSSDHVDMSWKRISSIRHHDSQHSLPEVQVLSPIKDKDSFRSLEVDSMEITEISDADETASNERTIIEAKQQSRPTRELKEELKLLFDDMRKQTKLSSPAICMPSPPRQIDLIEPDGISEWTESLLNSPLHSAALSASESETKTEKDNPAS